MSASFRYAPELSSRNLRKDETPGAYLECAAHRTVISWSRRSGASSMAAAENSAMLHLLKRHPLPIAAHFEHVLVLTYAFPCDLLVPLLPPGLELDTLGDYAFLTVATVQTRDLRPAFLPRAFGRGFFLTG